MKKVLILQILFSLLLLNFQSVYAATKAAPKSPSAEEYAHLGNLAGKQEKYKEAVRDYTKAIAAQPNYSDAYYNRGYVYIEMRKYKLAIKDLDKAIGINPKYAAAYHVRGIAYFLRKKYTQSVADYSKAIEIEPDNLSFYISRMSANFKLGDGDSAWKDVIKIQQLGGTVNPAIINILKDKKHRD